MERAWPRAPGPGPADGRPGMERGIIRGQGGERGIGGQTGTGAGRGTEGRGSGDQIFDRRGI